MDEEKLEKLKQELPDIQNLKDERQKSIKKVGIRQLKTPIRIKQPNGNVISTVGDWSVYTSLNEEVKGASMSRYSEIIHDVVKDSVSVDIISNMLKTLKEKLKSNDSYVKIRFTYFTKAKAPVSEREGYLHHDCILEGKSVNGNNKIYLTVTVGYTSNCPCSKEISDYGAHGQRGFATITVELNPNNILLIEDIVNIVENNSCSPLRPILKRPDERYVTMKAYDNAKFVEDIGRDIAVSLDEQMNSKIFDYVVVINHEENIHLHNAVAIISAGKLLH